MKAEWAVACAVTGLGMLFLLEIGCGGNGNVRDVKRMEETEGPRRMLERLLMQQKELENTRGNPPPSPGKEPGTYSPTTVSTGLPVVPSAATGDAPPTKEEHRPAATSGRTGILRPNPPSPSDAGFPTAGGNYRIGPEDILHIDVWANEELSGKYTVRPDGKISMPLVQDIHAYGLTADELAGRIHERLLPFLQDPTVSVIVGEINAPKFFLIGYVANPGKYPLRGDITVLQAISLGGGFTQWASPEKIRLVRNTDGRPDIREINYYDIIDTGGEGNYLLKPGDTLVVP